MRMNEKKNVSNDDIYKALMNLTAQNVEIKEDIKSLKKNLETKTTEINKNYEKLIKENEDLKLKLRISERRAKKNNIIIYGCQETNNENTLCSVLSLINEKLNIQLLIQEINNVYRIGVKVDNKVRPIRLELISCLKKSEIISQSYKLKGSAIYIRDDLTPEDLEERKLLLKHLVCARKKNIPAKIRNYKLIVNGEEFSYQDLEKTPLTENEDDEIDIRNLSPPPHRGNFSAPSTPNIAIEDQVFTELVGNAGEEEKIKRPLKESTTNVKIATPLLSRSRNTKKSSSGDNIRSSERIATAINKKP